jgi:hypothetical protein
MEDFGALTKSFDGSAELCPWAAAQFKIHGVKSISGRAARGGSSVHIPVAAIRNGLTTLDEYDKDPLRWMVGEFTDDEHQAIIDMVHRAFNSDPIVLSDTEKGRVHIEKYLAIDAKGKLTRGEPEPYHEHSQGNLPRVNRPNC